MIAMLMKKKAGQRPTFHKMKINAGSKFLSLLKVKRLLIEGEGAFTGGISTDGNLDPRPVPMARKGLESDGVNSIYPIECLILSNP